MNMDWTDIERDRQVLERVQDKTMQIEEQQKSQEQAQGKGRDRGMGR